MLGNGAVMSDKCFDIEADKWFGWIFCTAVRFGYDMTETAMSLSWAMAELSCEYFYDHMPEVMNLLACFLLRQEDAAAEDILNLDDKNIFEGLLVGALLGIGIKVVMKDSSK